MRYQPDDTQPINMTPLLLRDPACVQCGMGTHRYGQCLDCEQCHNEADCG